MENLLLDVISKITDENLRLIYLNELRLLFSKQDEEVPKPIQPTISHNKSLERFNKSKKEVIVQDLQLEIKQVKRDIKDLEEQFFKFTQDNDDSPVQLLPLVMKKPPTSKKRQVCH